jgi:hypothetical protein
MSKMYETISPHSVNIVAKIELIIIIVESLEEKVSAKYVGIVRSAITKISPTAFIAATTQSADNIRISV